MFEQKEKLMNRVLSRFHVGRYQNLYETELKRNLNLAARLGMQEMMIQQLEAELRRMAPISKRTEVENFIRMIHETEG